MKNYYLFWKKRSRHSSPRGKYLREKYCPGNARIFTVHDAMKNSPGSNQYNHKFIKKSQQSSYLVHCTTSPFVWAWSSNKQFGLTDWIHRKIRGAFNKIFGREVILRGFIGPKVAPHLKVDFTMNFQEQLRTIVSSR